MSENYYDNDSDDDVREQLAEAQRRAREAETRLNEYGIGRPADQLPDLEAQLDLIPEIVDGQWNPNAVRDTLNVIAQHAAAEGKQIRVPGSTSAGVRHAVNAANRAARGQR